MALPNPIIANIFATNNIHANVLLESIDADMYDAIPYCVDYLRVCSVSVLNGFANRKFNEGRAFQWWVNRVFYTFVEYIREYALSTNEWALSIWTFNMRYHSYAEYFPQNNNP